MRWCVVALFACGSSSSPPKPDPETTPPPPKTEREPPKPQPQPLERARTLIEALERGDADPLVALITPETTWVGIVADRTYQRGEGATTREHIVAAGESTRAHFGEFRRIAFVWEEDRKVKLVSEHAMGDFVFVVELDTADKLKHLGFFTPDRLPAPYDCGEWASHAVADRNMLTAPAKADRSTVVPTVAIVGEFGLPGKWNRASEIANGLACRGVSSLLISDRKPLTSVPDSIRLVIAYTAERDLAPASGVEVMLVDNPLPTPPRTSGPNVIAAHHVDVAVIERAAAFVTKK